MKLDVQWLLLVLKSEFKDQGKRPVVILCNKYEIHVDGKNRLKHVFDHLKSPANEEAMQLKDSDRAWIAISDFHTAILGCEF